MVNVPRWTRFVAVVVACFALAGSSPAHSQARLVPYTPAQGSPELAGIMDAIRLVQFAPKFQVHQLIVLRNGSRAIAVAEVSDASRQSDVEGIFLLEGLNQQWRGRYMVNGSGGASSCDGARKIHMEMIEEVTGFGGESRSMPASFWKSLDEAKAGGSEGHCTVAKRF